jgi:hypothetical protein
MAMPSPTKLTLSGLLYPLHCAEGIVRAEFWMQGAQSSRRWAALVGGLAAGATALFLLRTLAIPAGLAIALAAYFVGAVVTIVLRAIFATMSSNNADAA